MRLLKNPTKKIKKKRERERKTHPIVSFRCSLFKKRNKSIWKQERRSGRGREAHGFQRQPDSPGGKRRKAERHDGLLVERGKRREREERREERNAEERRRGAIKTLTTNLVYCVKKKKKPHAQQAPWGLRAHTTPRVAMVDTSSWPHPHSFTGQSGAVQALLLLLLQWWWWWWRRRQDLRLLCWSQCGERRADRPYGRGKNTKMPHFK